MAVETIPSLGFMRGVIVRKTEGGPNMLVVRGLGETTACVLCEGDAGGTLRLREFKTDDLEQVLGTGDAQDREFDLRWKADQRAIKRWQAAGPGRDLTWPDHADLVVWLLERLEAAEKATQ